MAARDLRGRLSKEVREMVDMNGMAGSSFLLVVPIAHLAMWLVGLAAVGRLSRLHT